MDRFLLNNAARYQALVKALGPMPAAKMTTGTSNPDMVITARIRPLLEEDDAVGFPCAVFPRLAQPGAVDIHNLYNHPTGRPILKSFSYQVDRVYDSQTTTEEIYDNLVVDLVPFAWNGGIGTLFAYGQTGSGKTFTVNRIEQLVVESLMDGSLEGERQVFITIIDLAGNSAYDLLNSRTPISILEDSFGVIQMAGAHEFPIESKDEAMDLIEHAASFRKTAPTLKNDASSRSHSICRIRIRNSSTDTDGFLYLVDLAGSEAARDIAEHGADRMRETREINISLSVLKDCIRGKVEADSLIFSGGPKSKQIKSRIPFRQSTLTKVLKHVFDPAGNRACKTAIIACVNPSLADVSSGKNTLRYAETLRVIVPSTQKMDFNPMAPMTWNNAQLKDWITKNSGTPAILSAVLAPTESGAQLLRLPDEEIESRCLKSPGISVEHAKAFRSKMWQMHIDSQRVGDMSNTPAPKLSSRDLDPTAMAVGFKERIRPGMVVSWNEPSGLDDGLKLVVVLCPVDAVKRIVRDVPGNVVNLKEIEHADLNQNDTDHSARYLCAVVTKGFMPESYELNMWQQIVVDVDSMDKEVLLEFDSGTRYYFMTV